MGFRRSIVSFVAVLVTTAVAGSASAVTIDFSDQAPITDEGLYSDVMSRDGVTVDNTYSFASGLTITFTGFGRNHEAWAYFDASNDPESNYGKLWGTSNTPTIEFSKPVFVSSFWVYNSSGNYGTAGEEDTWLFTVTGTGPNPYPAVYEAPSYDPEFTDLFWEVTGTETFDFADYAITKLEFTKFQDVLFDQLTFELVPSIMPADVPEPSAAAAVLGIAGWVVLRRQKLARQSRLP